ncbi:MAG: hypothetical protein ACLR7D_04300 [Lachnospira eligens]
MDMTTFLQHFLSGEATTGKLSYKLRIDEIAREYAHFTVDFHRV